MCALDADYLCPASAGAVVVGADMVDVGAVAGVSDFGASLFWQPATVKAAIMATAAMIALIFFISFTPFLLMKYPQAPGNCGEKKALCGVKFSWPY